MNAPSFNAGPGPVDPDRGQPPIPWPPLELAVPPPARPPSPVADLLLRIAGGVVSVVGGFATGALVVLLVPLRLSQLAGLPELPGVGAVRVPLAVGVAIGGALFLVWFARRATGLRWGVGLPAIGWFTMVVVALRTTSGGDRLLMPDDWVATVALFGGTVVLVVGLVVNIVGPGQRRQPPGPA